jgi:hypothetical protein
MAIIIFPLTGGCTGTMITPALITFDPHVDQTDPNCTVWTCLDTQPALVYSTRFDYPLSLIYLLMQEMQENTRFLCLILLLFLYLFHE